MSVLLLDSRSSRRSRPSRRQAPPERRTRFPAFRALAAAFVSSLLMFAGGCEPTESVASDPAVESDPSTAATAAEPETRSPKMATATFGGGCFWCTEAVFLRLKGVVKVVSGYMGGTLENPTYEEICTGLTGHAECIQVTYDENQVSYEDLLEIFWKTHDPTTLNQQGADRGTQYRSVVFFHSPEQKELAEKWKKKLDESGVFSAPIVTEISEATKFYPAEDYHQDYYANNPANGYCQYNIEPKFEKLEKLFADKLKPAAGADR